MSASPRGVAGPVFLLLFLPFGIAIGYVTLTLGYLLAARGVGTEAIGGLVGLYWFAQLGCLLGAPLLETRLTYRAWYALSALAIGLGVALTAILPAGPGHLFWLGAVLVLISVAAAVLATIVSGFMALCVPADRHGRAGGWSAIGNIGGSGMGGGVGLWLAHHAGASLAAAALGAGCVACCTGLAAIRLAPRPRQSFARGVAEVGRAILGMIRSRRGLLAIAVLLLPMGTGGVANLWGAVAGDWHASADLVALGAGLSGAAAAAAGCLIAGWLCDRAGGRTVYVGSAAAQAAIALAMAASPRTPAMFVMFVLLYALINGCMYASFYGVVLETVGERLVAAKALVMTCLPPLPVMGVTMLDGAAQTRLGSGGMLLTEAGLAIVSLGVFGVLMATTRRLRAPAVAAP